jgi:hypothetical protein
MPKDPFDQINSLQQALKDYLDSPAARLTQSYLDSPAAKFAESYLNSPAAKLAESYLDNPTLKLAQSYLDNPAFKLTQSYLDDSTFKLAQSYLDDSTFKLAQSYLDDSTFKLAQSYLDDSTFKLTQSYLDDSTFKLAQSYLDDPALKLTQSYLDNPALPIFAQHSLGYGAFVGSDATLATQLAATSHSLHFSSELERFRSADASLARAMTANHTRWLDIAAIPRSVSAFTTLNAFGNALQVALPFDESVTSALRAGLGDWRHAHIPENMLNKTVRHNFYIDRGLDLALTAFPTRSYSRILSSAGLSQTPTADTGETSEDLATDLSAEAFRMLRPFEIEFREFLAASMSSRFGKDWIKQRVSGETRKRWERRLEDAVRDGEKPLSLHAYADLFDYAEIIIRNDNWIDLFEGIFLDKNEVQVSFKRLNAVRRPVVHSREISNEDLLFVNVEVIRLRRSVKRFQ